MGKKRGSYANVVRGGTHNLRRRSNEQGGGRQTSGQPQAGSSNSDPRPSTSGGSQGSIDTGNKPDENVSNIFYLSKIVWSTFGKFVAIFLPKFGLLL